MGNNPVNWNDPYGLVGPIAPAIVVCLADPPCATALGALTMATGMAIRQLLSELTDKINRGEPITPEDIEKAEKEREEQLKQCKTSTGTPPPFPGPDPNKPPEDPKLKRKFVVARLLQLLHQVGKYLRFLSHK